MNRPIKFILFGLIILSLSLAVAIKENPNSSKPADTYEVKKVVDGDTLEVTRYGKTEKVRLIGIDTPETLDPRKPVQCFGKEASDNSKGLLSGKQVKLDFDPVVDEKDKYGRLLAYVWNDNELVNLRLIKDGYAHEYTYRNQQYKYQNDFKQAEKYAKESGSGLWSSKTCNGITK